MVTHFSLRLGLELSGEENCIKLRPILLGCKMRNPQNLAGSVPNVPTSANILIQKKEQKSLLLESVIPAGFEPTTHSLEGCCSIQLSYGINSLKCQHYPHSHHTSTPLSISIWARAVDFHTLAVQNYAKYINPPNFSAILISV